MNQIDCTYCANKQQCSLEGPKNCILISITEEIERMQSFLEITTSEDPIELVPRLSDLNVAMARSGKMLADAKELQDSAIAMVYEIHGDYISHIPATIATKFITAKTANINKLVTWIDRINRACVHQGENIRTQISFAKEDLKLTRKGY